MRRIFVLAIGTAAVLLGTRLAYSRGFAGAHAGGYAGGGGGYHAGGYTAGGYHAGGYSAGAYHASGAYGGGYRAGGVEAGGYRAGGVEAGGYRAGGVEAGGVRAGGVEAGGYRAGGVAAGGYRAGGVEAGGYRAGGVAAGGYRAGGVEAGGYRAGGAYGYGAGHVGFPTDMNFSRGWAGGAAGGYAAAGHWTRPIAGGAMVANGAAVRNSFSHWGAFGPGWYTAHPGAWAAAGWTAGRAWTAATWPALTGWYGWSGVGVVGTAAQPVYYDYGTNITYQGDQVYYESQPVATADQYYQQAADLAQVQSAAPPDPQSNDWLPLGVFSLVQGDQSDSDNLFQLATSKSGAIAGNFYSALSGTTLPVQGSADRKTLRAAWTVGDNKTTVYDTGINNLTKDQAPLLVHVGKDKTQQWLLVRLKQPQQPQESQQPGIER